MRERIMLVAGVLLLAGCSGGTKIDIGTPKGRKEVAYKAGHAAALAYLAGANPKAEDLEVLRSIVLQVRDNVKGFEKKGFVGALPGIEKLIDELITKEEDAARKLAAKKLAKMLLEELDKVFDDHPEWKDLSEEIASLVTSFASGASAGLGS